MKIVLFGFLLLMSTAMGQSPIQVIALDPDVDLESLDDSKVEKLHGIDPALTKNPNALPDVDKMQQLFKEAGLNKEISQMDNLDRDMLYRWTRRLSLSDLTKKYPDISESKLAKLKSLAGVE